MSIRFKFRRSMNYETVDIDGQDSITVSDLKSKIRRQRNVNVFSADCDLVLSDAVTGFEYRDGHVKIQSGSSVIIERVPASSVASMMCFVEDDMAGDRRLKLVGHFLKLNPPTYAGVEGSEAAEEFLNRAEMIFDLLECTSREKVELATYSLNHEADAWWTANKESVEMEYDGDAWERFRQAFLDKYFPFTVREDKAREFNLLQQTEEMSVDQYEAKFSELSWYAPEIVNTSEKRARKFERGLLSSIQILLAALMLTNYEEIYRRAQKIEKTQRECTEREGGSEKRFVDEDSSKGPSKSLKRGRFFRREGITSVPRYSGYVLGPESMSMSPPSCRRCGKWHQGWACPSDEGMRGMRCYQCGQLGHVRRFCLQKQRPVSTGMSGASRGRESTIRPQSSMGSVSRGRGQGMVNAITEQDA